MSPTPFLDSVYSKIEFDGDRELVFKFFVVFSLFEYALKKANFCEMDGRNNLQVKWDSFVENIRSKFNPDEVQNSVSYFKENPPRKQVLSNNHLDFEDTPEETDTLKSLSILIRRVRNNLFHGGKFRYEPSRDTKLISHALKILENWSQCNAQVKQILKVSQ